MTLNDASFGGVQNLKGLCSISRYSMNSVSVKTDAIWSIWKAPVGESQCSPLGFWTKTIPAATENDENIFQKTSPDWT